MLARFAVPFLAIACLAGAACSSSPSNGAPSAEAATPTPSDTGTGGTAAESGDEEGGLQPFTQAEVQRLFDQRCVRCHGRSNPLLDLSAPFTRETVGVAAGGPRSDCDDSAHRVRIVPGDREASLLFHKVKGSHDCGKVMPYDKPSERLGAEQIERLGLFIDQLAL